MYPDSGYKRAHAQSVCTRPFSRVGRGLGTRLGLGLASTYIRVGCIPLLSSVLEPLKGDVRLHQTSDKSICFRIARRDGWGWGLHTSAGPLHSIQMGSQL